MNEVLTNISKFGHFCNPIANFNEDCAVKFVVALQLAYKTIDNLGTETQNPWK
jgi:hypothetical protein